MDFRNKVVIITGSSKGIGKSLALKLSDLGAKVVLNGRDEHKLDQTYNEFINAGYDCLSVVGDVSIPDDCKQLIEKTILKFSSIDIIIINAGISAIGDVSELNPETAKQVIDVNYLGAHYLSHFGIPHLKKTKGNLIFVSSLAGIRGLPGYSIYSSSKMALTSLAESLKIELNKYAIHIGILYLGFTENDVDKKMFDKDGILIPQKSDHNFKPASREKVILKILRSIEKRKFKTVLTPLGKTMYLINRFFPFLLELIFKNKYQ